MEHKDLTQLVREYVKVEKQLEPLKELEKKKNELKKEITKEMERRTLERFNFNGRYITYIKEYVRPAYEVPECTIAPSVRIQGGTR